MSKILVIMLTIAASAVIGFSIVYPKKESPESRMRNATVMITAIKGGGGSGSIVYSDESYSLILTNAHVCKIMINGGRITNVYDKSALIESYSLYEDHDLCLAKVSTYMGPAVNLSKKPAKIQEKIIISGHPNLLPQTFSEGRITGKQEIDIMIELRQCNEEETKENILCVFFGGIPVLKKMETISTSALIMPGSSGSAVYNEDAEIVAVVFAGRQGLSYGFLVPYEHVYQFLNQKETYFEKVNYESGITN